MIVVVVECYYFLINIIVGEAQARRSRPVSTGYSFSLKMELPLRKNHEPPNAVVVVVAPRFGPLVREWCKISTTTVVHKIVLK